MKIGGNNELDNEQNVAILEEESVLLVACPGSGKTRALTYKIAQELTKLETHREFIIAITYTNAGADEIKERIELLGQKTTQLWIGTIHSFCLEWILRPYSPLIETLKYGFQVIGSHEKEEIIKQLCKKYTKHGIRHWDCEFMATPDEYQITSPNKWKHEAINQLLSEYFLILSEKRFIDFEMILFHSLNLVRKYKIIPSTLAKLFKIILIDEYQDTKKIQYHIITEILKSRKGKLRTFIVGDPNQSIYESLGGYPMPIKEIEGLLEFGLIPKDLHKNYRSSSRIIEYFSNFKTHPSKVVAVGKNKSYKSVLTYNKTVHKDDLIAEIARLIKYNIQECGISPNEVCIAAPRWLHLASVTRKLMVELPDYNFDGPGMVPFARDIENIWYKLSRIILTEPSPDMYIRRLRWSSEFLHDLQNAGINTNTIDQKAFLKLCNSIEINETNGLEHLKLFFEEICKLIGISIDDNNLLNDLHSSFFDSSKKRIEELIKDGNTSIESIESFRRVFKQKQGITISTIHGVKGEEYDTMICFGLLEGYVPHLSDENGQMNAMKQLYVVCSRARKNLHLISERGRLNRNMEQLPPTKLLSDLIYEYDTI